MLKQRDQLPFFDVTTLDGRQVGYEDVWQRRNLVLVIVADRGPDAIAFASDLESRLAEATARDTAVVVTADGIEGLPAPGAVVADRWGEIHYLTTTPDAAGMPDANGVIDALQHVLHRCPECEGEAR